MKNNKILTGLFAGLLLTSASITLTQAEDSPISANVTIVSDYVWRGVTQTDDEIAIQGGFDYDAGNGFAIGVWGSNIDFNSTASSEFDLYGSYGGEMNDLGYEIGYIAYRYPSESAIDFEEIYITGSYNSFGLTYYNGLDEAKDYVEASYDFDLEDVGISVLYGDYEDSYSVYGVGIAKSYIGLDFGLNYTSTDHDDNSEGKNNTVFSVSKSF